MAKEQSDEPGGSLLGALVGALISVFIGTSLAVVNQASIPVSEVRELPEADIIDKSIVYFVKGDEKQSTQWKSKRDTFKSGSSGEIRLNSGELNRWARSQFKPATDEESGFITIIPSPPNFLIKDESLQISTYLEIPQIFERRIVFQAEGNFESLDQGPAFQPDRMFLGSCPIPGPLQGFFYDFFSRGFFESEEYLELTGPWSQVTNAEVSDGTLTIVAR